MTSGRSLMWPWGVGLGAESLVVRRAVNKIGKRGRAIQLLHHADLHLLFESLVKSNGQQHVINQEKDI